MEWLLVCRAGHRLDSVPKISIQRKSRCEISDPAIPVRLYHQIGQVDGCTGELTRFRPNKKKCFLYEEEKTKQKETT